MLSKGREIWEFVVAMAVQVMQPQADLVFGFRSQKSLARSFSSVPMATLAAACTSAVYVSKLPLNTIVNFHPTSR